MTDYHEMSDFEINLAVVRTLGLRPSKAQYFGDAGQATVRLEPGEGGHVDYCNSWADAGPIILKNRISVIFDESDTENPGVKFEWCGAISDCHKHQVPYLSNPLRAAMIVFLMMKKENSNEII